MLSTCDWLGSVLLCPCVSCSSLWPNSDHDIIFILTMEGPMCDNKGFWNMAGWLPSEGIGGEGGIGTAHR